MHRPWVRTLLPQTCLRVGAPRAAVAATLRSSPPLRYLRKHLVATKGSWDSSGLSNKNLLFYNDSKYKGRAFEWIFSSSATSGLTSHGSLYLLPMVEKWVPSSGQHAVTQSTYKWEGARDPQSSLSLSFGEENIIQRPQKCPRPLDQIMVTCSCLCCNGDL